MFGWWLALLFWRGLWYERSQCIWLLISLLILYLNKIESPLPKNACFVQSPGEIYATRCMVVKKKIMTTIIRLNSIWVSCLNIYSSEPKARYTHQEEMLNIYISYSPEASHFYWNDPLHTSPILFKVSSNPKNRGINKWRMETFFADECLKKEVIDTRYMHFIMKNFKKYAQVSIYSLA